MVVHINPYDSTGFEENASVMRFAAVAQELQVTGLNKLSQQVTRAVKQAIQPMKIKVPVPVLKDEAPTDQIVEELFDFEIIERKSSWRIWSLAHC